MKEGHNSSKASNSQTVANDLNNSFSSSSNTDSTRKGNEFERRRTQYTCQTKIKDEIRKAEQGITCETKIAEIFQQVEQTQTNGPSASTMRTIKADGQTLEQLTKLSITEIQKLRQETARTLDPDLFLAKLKTFVTKNIEEEPGVNIFCTLGKHYAHTLRTVPDFYYLRPCIENAGGGPKLRQKAPRKNTKRVKQETQEIKAKTLTELQQERTDETSVSKELDNVKKHLRASYKQHKSNEIDYYPFVLSPDENTGFGETIENMFYISFLVKDGHIRLRIEPETGCPKIVKLTQEERENFNSIRETVQLVSRLDYNTWRLLVKKLGIKEPYIKRKPQ